MSLTEKQISDLIQMRHALHRQPDLSGDEAGTAASIVSYLQAFEPDGLICDLGGAGVAAIFDSGRAGKTVMVRCELDGLPIQEIGSLPYSSTIPGRGHQCGHDGHMAIVLGVAAMLRNKRPATGRTILLFQPAEETGKGAKAVICDPRYATLNPDFVLALHNLPGYDKHQIILKSGQVNCASRGMRIKLTGRTAHASMPQTGVSPALAMATMIRDLAALSNAKTMNQEFRLVTIVHAHLGEKAFGVAPAHAETWATLRTVTDEKMQQLARDAEAFCQKNANEHGLTLDIAYDDIFNACQNDDGLIAQYRQSAGDLGYRVLNLVEPMRFSEDFGEYATAQNGSTASAMFFLGAGPDHPALHNPDYDFPDALIRSGANMFYATINRLLT
ncbi:MAG: amidohydrolase [Rhizobiaceae bacterium]|nr:amidohydrolase [Rhizobiaceae bacterium]